MKRILFLAFVLVFVVNHALLASYRMNYRVGFEPDNSTMQVTLSLGISGTDVGKPVLLKLPVWAPGYYLIVDYPKNIYDFTVRNNSNEEVEWQKEGKNGWRILSSDTLLTIRYTVFAQGHSCAESFVYDSNAFVAPNGTFLYLDNHKDLSTTITLDVLNSWQHVSTSLKCVGKNTYYAPDVDVLYDTPVLLGNYYSKTFHHEGHDYEFAIIGAEGVEEGTFEQDFKKMVSATTRLMGDVPYEKYTMIHLGQGGGGLEHQSSQACYTSGSYRFDSQDEYLNHLSYVSHEYFHLYNVKTIRPIELGPFDYDREVFTPMLWVSEGFTCYYELRNLLTAGIVSADYLLKQLSSSIEKVETEEGHRHMSLRQSSYDIWLNFFNTNANHADVTISYYDKGPILGLLFDIELRYATQGKRGLDDLMRLLYNRFYKQLQRGFTEEEFWQCTEEVAAQPMPHLRKYVDTTCEIPYDELLAHAGLGLNTTTWQLYRLSSLTSSQKKIRKCILEE